MSGTPCSSCNQPFPVQSLFDLNGQTLCKSCVPAASEQARQSGLSHTVVPLITKSICARCNTFLGSDSAPVQIGGLRFCQTCAPLIKDFDYPVWLKMSMAALLLLLVVALANGRKYFQVGRDLYVGEHLIEQGKYAEALPRLVAAVKFAPNSDKASLLTAKAALHLGDLKTASEALQGHNGGHFEDGNDAQFVEVNGLWERANSALEKAERAGKLTDEDGKGAEAAELMHQAAAQYPELPILAAAAESYDAGAAFDRKDYDAYLAFGEKDWKLHPSASSAATLASGLACKFAVANDPAYKLRAIEMLEKAKQLSQGDPDAQKNLEEYFPRIQYRLDTRQIISKQEYDKRFRGAGLQTK